jgi:hypothetical protein
MRRFNIITLFAVLVAFVSVSHAQIKPDSLLFYQKANGISIPDYFSGIRRWKALPGDLSESGYEHNLTIDYQDIEKGEMILRGWTDKLGGQLKAELFNCISVKYYYTIFVNAIRDENGEVIKFKWELKDVKAVFSSSYGSNYSYLSDEILYTIRTELKEIQINGAEIMFDNYCMSKIKRMREELSEYETAANDETLSRRQRRKNTEVYNEFKTKLSVYEAVYTNVDRLKIKLSLSTYNILK